MALTNTTLAIDATIDTLTFNVTSSTGATVGGFMRIDAEWMMIVEIPIVNFIRVRSRGDRGGFTAPHNALAIVTFGLPSDMVNIAPREEIPIPRKRDNLRHIGANTTLIPCPIQDTTFIINKASALASTTLANPGKDQNGLQITFRGVTDFAHVITVTTCTDGTTGNSTTLTSPAFSGGGITLEAHNGTWLVVQNTLWVVT